MTGIVASFENSLNGTLGNNSNATANLTCDGYIPMEHLDVKIYLVGVVGTLVALVGIVSNSLLVYVFFRPSVRVSSIIYLAVLAMLDIWMLITYILIFPLNIWYDYYKSLPLFRFWMFYVRPMLTISKIIQLASTYLIVAATVDRFLSQYGLNCSKNFRGAAVALVLVLSFLAKGSSYFEIDIIYRAHCYGFEEKDIYPGYLATESWYRDIVMFYMNHIVQVFLPFFILLLMNVLIILRMKRAASSNRQDDTIRQIARYPPRATVLFVRPTTRPESVGRLQRDIMLRIETKKQLREATQMLFMIVFMYLLFNSVSLVITTMEHIMEEFLRAHPTFYTFAVDCMSLLSVLNSTLRILIYYCFNGTIRKEFHLIFEKIGLRRRPQYTSVRRSMIEDAENRNGHRHSKHFQHEYAFDNETVPNSPPSPQGNSYATITPLVEPINVKSYHNQPTDHSYFDYTELQHHRPVAVNQVANGITRTSLPFAEVETTL